MARAVGTTSRRVNEPRRGVRTNGAAHASHAVRSYAPPGLLVALVLNPWLTPWATFCGRTAAKILVMSVRARLILAIGICSTFAGMVPSARAEEPKELLTDA